jgi:hypothetical protein
MPTIKVDFVGEWTSNIRAGLAAAGYAVSADLNHNELCHRYMNLQRRLVSRRPRAVFKAIEFTCPWELAESFTQVQQKIETGDDLRPHLSRGLTDLEGHDMLLNDWGIHHLHLGTTLDSDGFVERTGPVLFVRFENDFAYLLTVLPHGSWARQDFVRSLHRNWPQSISLYRLQGVVGLAQELADEDIAQARNIKIKGEKKKRAALSTFVEVEPGVVYAPIGGGYSTAQTSIKVVFDCDRIIERLQAYENRVRELMPDWIEEAATRGIEITPELSFRLGKLGDDVVAIEENTKQVMVLSPRGT